MKTILKHSILVLWLSLFCMVALASCKTNNGEQPTVQRITERAPLLATPFTHGEIGVLMRKGQDDLLDLVNALIAQMKADGTLRELHEKYGLVRRISK